MQYERKVGPGILLCGARKVTEGMLLQASLALTEYTDPARVAAGAVFPRIDRIRGASRHVAAAVIAQAQREGVATVPIPEELAGAQRRLVAAVGPPVEVGTATRGGSRRLLTAHGGRAHQRTRSAAHPRAVGAQDAH